MSPLESISWWKKRSEFARSCCWDVLIIVAHKSDIKNCKMFVKQHATHAAARSWMPALTHLHQSQLLTKKPNKKIIVKWKRIQKMAVTDGQQNMWKVVGKGLDTLWASGCFIVLWKWCAQPPPCAHINTHISLRSVPNSWTTVDECRFITRLRCAENANLHVWVCTRGLIHIEYQNLHSTSKVRTFFGSGEILTDRQL